MNLAMLLLGPGNLQRSRSCLIALGALLLATGLAIVIDASDTVTVITLEAFGWVMVAMGLFKLALTVLAQSGGLPAFLGFQGLVYIILGIAIADFPSESGNAMPWLFGLALLLNGLYQASCALVIRYPLWGWLLTSGIGHLVLGGLLFFHWKQAAGWVVPLILGVGFVMMGLTILRTALRLGRYLRGREDGAGMAVRYFLDFHVPQRFRRHYFPSEPEVPREAGQPCGDLLVHIWTPTTVAGVDRSLSPVSRYVAARDREGKFAVGHAALELAPDVYISHCDGDPTAFENGDAMWQTLRSKDVQGVFLPSFEEEIKTYVQPSVTFRFRNFSEGQLRTFWALYRAVTDYNFTNRNCSVAVAMALEAALMGSLSTKSRLRTLLSLMTSKDIWVAHFVRWKAREAVWTPGLMQEYALALHRVVEAES
jgi:uncharacterized membrane protein HdeD (DUF308 family)